MITDIFFIIVGWLITVLSFILPTWSFVQQGFIDGVNFCVQTFAGLNFLFPFDTLFTVILFYITFEVAYFGAKIVIGIIHFFRGTGEINI